MTYKWGNWMSMENPEWQNNLKQLQQLFLQKKLHANSSNATPITSRLASVAKLF